MNEEKTSLNKNKNKHEIQTDRNKSKIQNKAKIIS